MYDHRSDRVGQQLGEYRLLRLLAQRGFADVYLGEHLTVNNRVVLRVFRAVLSDEDHEEFLREVQLLSGLDHPHILRVLDAAVEGGLPFIVMDSPSYETLRQRHPPGARLALETIVTYLKHVASALRYVHDQHNLIHRNIHPGSLVLDPDDAIVLSDFSHAFLAHHSMIMRTQVLAEAVVEAISYMAPEQIQGKPHQASDQYALGVMTYEWLCGRPPFSGSPLEIIGQHLSYPPSSMLGQVPELPPALEEVVFKALAKEPEQRFASAQDFVLALEQACR